MRYRRIAVLIFVLTSVGCSTWRPVALAPREYIANTQPTWVRVRYATGREQILRKPGIRGDSIIELGSLCTNGRCVERMSTAPFVGITSLEVRETSAPRTVLAVTATTIGLLVFAFIVTWGGQISLPPTT